jgi:hypothetical protein
MDIPRSFYPYFWYIPMTYLVPYELALPPNQQARMRGMLLQDELGIPPDTYKLFEFYCPNPDCHCDEARLKVVAVDRNEVVANIRVFFPTPLPAPPILDATNPNAAFAPALLRLISENIQNDPVYFQQLQDHYHLVKTVATDPSHPAHTALVRWGQTGGLKQPVHRHKGKNI